MYYNNPNYNATGFGQQSVLQNDAINGNDCRIILFSPRSHGRMVHRPMEFNFNNQVAEEFIRHGNYSKNVGGFRDNESLQRAIVPSAMGIEVDSGSYDCLWSFILKIDNYRGQNSLIHHGSPKKRLVLTGYFLEEPINPNTIHATQPTINLNATLIFSRKSLVSIQSLSGGRGMRPRITSTDMDYTAQFTASTFMNNEAVALCDAGTVSKCMMSDVNGGYALSSADAYIGQLSENKSISAQMRSPKHQLACIGNAVESAVNMHDNSYGHAGVLGEAHIMDDPTEGFMSSAKVAIANEAVPFGSADIVQNGIDLTGVVTLGLLDSVYPNMSVIPIGQPTVPNFDVIDQGEVTVHNTMHSLIAASIPSLAAEFCLSNVAFRYATWSPSALNGNTPTWEVISAGTLSGDDGNGMLNNALSNFKNLIDSSLMPTLRSFGGEFDMIVHYDMSGSTIIDLKFLDYNDNRDGGYYEHHNKLGGFVNPTIGTDSTLTKNSTELHNLLNSVASAEGIGHKDRSDMLSFNADNLANSQPFNNNNNQSGIYGAY